MSDSDDNGSDKTMVIRPAFKRPDAPKAKLVCIDPTVLPNSPHVEVGLSGAELTFGRGEENAVVLNVAGISRNHAKIMPGEGAWGVEDSGSTNGVFVNKTKVVGQVWLKADDIVSIGKVHYKYSLETEAPAAPPSSHEIYLGESEKR